MKTLLVEDEKKLSGFIKHGLEEADYGTYHWIEYIELIIGNDPVGRIDMQAKGYLKPKASFRW
jgi:desulfoferrodoxin (superoxide reductase-like protein)